MSVLALFAACGDDDDVSEPASTSPSDILAEAMRRAEEADSYVLELSTRYDDTTSLQTIAYESPDTVYSRTTESGVLSESLALDGDYYVTLPSEELWYVAPDIVFSSPLSGTPLGDEKTRDEFVANSQFVGEDESTGGEVFHYRYTMDMSFLSEEFSGECAGKEFEFNYGPAVMDMWIDPHTSLLGKWQVTGDLTLNGESLSYESTGEFSNFDDSYPIPTAPPDAEELPDFGFKEIFEECFGGG